MSERVAVAFLNAEDVREAHPELSEEEAEAIVAWLASNCMLSERPSIMEALIREAMETLVIGRNAQ